MWKKQWLGVTLSSCIKIGYLDSELKRYSINEIDIWNLNFESKY